MYIDAGDFAGTVAPGGRREERKPITEPKPVPKPLERRKRVDRLRMQVDKLTGELQVVKRLQLRLIRERAMLLVNIVELEFEGGR